MSQEYFSPKGKAPSRRDDDSETNDHDATDSPSSGGRPGYMQVGSGSTSHHAARLQSLLENDSGYGGSIADGDFSAGKLPMGSPRLDPSLGDNPILAASVHNDADRRNQDATLHQLWYNQQRLKLGRSINKVVELLKSLQELNVTWPAHYPSVQRAEDASPERERERPSSSQRPTFHQTHSMAGEPSSSRHPNLRRSMTSFNEYGSGESSKDAETRSVTEPRLVSPQIAQEFSILKLDLKLGALHQAELVHSLEKGSIASLLDGKISSSIKHLQSLRERIDDTSSKVLITGDLNAGKSTFCNALLRRKVLPEDQQPCTSIFCEVLDAARENGGVEEVHAVHKDATYNRHDETTYDVFSLQELENIVVDNTNYMQCKVYVRDVRTIDESLLTNGVVDIALIDAPGLNSDTTKTTAVFARQEEIDVVVFVVSAANHFTMTAKEFIWAAAAEKAYLFIVVNGFDTIKAKERCEKMILDQVHGLSPRTFKESSELVHFVSSNAVPTAPPPGGPDGGGSGSSSGGGGDDDPSNDPKGKGKDKEKIQDFEKLEQSLRRFVLEKRARSKLAPAKTYLTNILNDVNVLATVNSEVAQSELDRVLHDLREIEPLLDASRKAKLEVSEEIDHTIEETCKDIYDHTRDTLNRAIVNAGENTQGVPYSGIFNAFQYAEDLKEAMLAEIQESVTVCEEHARTKTVGGVNAIKQLGLLHLGDEYEDLSFRSDVMFRRRRDVLAKQIEIPTEFLDFVDWSTLVQRQEKVAGTGMALTVATALGSRMIGGYGWLDHTMSAARVLGNDNLRRLIVPGLIVAVLGAAAYVLQQIPQSLPHRLSNKISTQLEAIDYIHANSARISSSVRKVLRYPADNLRVGLQRSVEQLGARRDETLKTRGESEVALKYFGNLVRESAAQRRMVEEVDLEAHPQGTPGVTIS
ncbi:putative Dynamin-type G domain-containing protein [Seiridium unicorne]|uniref:Dynamin-type G domain-containing protein n=1 Tax=Seiridium unicorne TaxID=138068 RepID=A0ABR2V5P0_9PEZI